MKEVDEMNERDTNQVKADLRELFVTGRGRMIAFDFTKDKETLDQAGFLTNNTQATLVRDPKTDLVIVVC